MSEKLEQLLDDEGMGGYDFYTKDDVIYFAKECIQRCADIALHDGYSGDAFMKQFGIE